LPAFTPPGSIAMDPGILFLAGIHSELGDDQ